MTTQDPHKGQPVLAAGALPGEARVALLMVHGRGATAEDILTLAEDLDLGGVAYLAPQAADDAWYPNRFLAPLADNEPWLSSALRFLGQVLEHIRQAGIPPERTVLLGFSQGACLALEFAARNPRRYGGIVGLSGALIGPDGVPRQLTGSLEGSSVFLGCSETDSYVSKERVQQAAQVLGDMGGQVTLRLYPGLGHTTNEDEIEFVRGMVLTLSAAP